MSGSATLTMVTSRSNMKTPITTAVSVHHFLAILVLSTESAAAVDVKMAALPRDRTGHLAGLRREGRVFGPRS